MQTTNAFYFLLLFLFTLVKPVLGSSGANRLVNCTSDVRADSVQPAGSPVLVIVRIDNQTNEPIPYDVASRNAYPCASIFNARVTDAKGQVEEICLFNDQDIKGSSRERKLPAGQSVDMPAMIIEGLPVGSYTIQVRQGKSAKVTIKEDPELARKWDEDLVAKIAKGDRFANHVCSILLQRKRARPCMVDALVRRLSSEDEKEVERFASTLGFARELPPSALPIITKALRKHLESFKKGALPEGGILGILAAMVSQFGTDGALESVLELAHTHDVRGNAVWALGNFKQEKALNELRLFLKDEKDQIRFRAAQRLAERKDAQALETLLVVADDPKSRWRMYSFESLLQYPNDPRVEKAIKNVVDNGDPSNPQVRQFAEIALRKLLGPNKKS